MDYSLDHVQQFLCQPLLRTFGSPDPESVNGFLRNSSPLMHQQSLPLKLTQQGASLSPLDITSERSSHCLIQQHSSRLRVLNHQKVGICLEFSPTGHSSVPWNKESFLFLKQNIPSFFNIFSCVKVSSLNLPYHGLISFLELVENL